MSQIGSVRTATSLAVLVIQAAEMSGPLPCAQSSWLWFSDVPADLELAKAACRRCPLRRPCLAGAVERGEACGVWGGEIFESGVIIAQKRPRGRPAGKQPRKTRTSESRERRAARPPTRVTARLRSDPGPTDSCRPAGNRPAKKSSAADRLR